MASGAEDSTQCQTQRTRRTIGCLAFDEFPCSFRVAHRLSTLLDVPNIVGNDYRCFLEELGLLHNTVRFLGEKCERPTFKALEGQLSKTTFNDIVNALLKLERFDCVCIVRDALLEQIRHKPGKNGDRNAITDNKLIEADIKKMLSWNCCKLIMPQEPQGPRSVHEIGVHPTRNVPQEVCHHIRMIRSEIVRVVNRHVIRTRSDPGVKSSLLSLTTTLVRVVLLFLIFNDVILLINAVLPIWSSLHDFSIIEHLAVFLLVVGDWVLEPKISALKDVMLEMKMRKKILVKVEKELNKERKKMEKWKRKQSSGSLDVIIKRKDFVTEELEELSRKENTLMKSIRSTYLFIFPLQWAIFIIGSLLYYYDNGGSCTSYGNILFKCCLAVLCSDLIVRNAIILIHYVTLNAVGRFDFRNEDVTEKFNEYELHLHELYKEKLTEQVVPDVKVINGNEGRKKRGRRKRRKE
ncbi:uncharacterized protein LOC144449940 [Glandiceps talaboti]